MYNQNISKCFVYLSQQICEMNSTLIITKRAVKKHGPNQWTSQAGCVQNRCEEELVMGVAQCLCVYETRRKCIKKPLYCGITLGVYNISASAKIKYRPVHTDMSE